MFRFEHDYILFGLILIPILWILFLLARRSKTKAIKAFGELSVIQQLMPNVSKAKSNWKFILVSSGLAFLIIGAAGPQFGSKLEEVKREGIEIIIALDVSNSMMAEDIRPNRLERAKQAISRLVEKLQDDRIGLIVFAGDAYIQIPITSDYISAKMFLETINTNIVPKQGTAIGSAIELGMRSFSPNSDASKVLVIITDGENHEDDAVKAAEVAAEKGITVYTIGMGSPNGSPIPVYTGAGKSFRKDNQGNTVISKLDEETLNKIAIAGNGNYILASNSNVGLNKLFDDLKELETAEFDSKVYTDYEDRFQYLIGLAFLILLIEVLTVERKSKWLSNINLFGDKK
jgi:Ca-activated chloride channel family protein